MDKDVESLEFLKGTHEHHIEISEEVDAKIIFQLLMTKSMEYSLIQLLMLTV